MNTIKNNAMVISKTKRQSWSMIPKKNIAVVVRELERIEDNDGIITPEAVIESAKPVSSPLHGYFEWNNNKAADKYRLAQARMLIRSVSVVYEMNGDGRHSRGFVNMMVQTGSKPAERGYIGIARVMSDDELRAQLLEQAKQEAKEWRQRYNNLAELANVFEAIDNL